MAFPQQDAHNLSCPVGCKPVWGGTVFGGPIKHDKIWFLGTYNMERLRTAGAPILPHSLRRSRQPPPEFNNCRRRFQTTRRSRLCRILAQRRSPLAIPFSAIFRMFLYRQTEPTQTSRWEPSLDSFSSPFNDYEATGRVDVQLTQKDRFFARYIFQQSATDNVPVSTDPGDAQGEIINIPGRSQQIGLDLTHTFNPSLLNQVRFSYSRASSAFEGGAFPDCLLASSRLSPARDSASRMSASWVRGKASAFRKAVSSTFTSFRIMRPWCTAGT